MFPAPNRYRPAVIYPFCSAEYEDLQPEPAIGLCRLLVDIVAVGRIRPADALIVCDGWWTLVEPLDATSCRGSVRLRTTMDTCRS